MKMKIWSIVWRVVYILFLVGSVYGIVTGNGNEGLAGILFICLGCLILNIPYYIISKLNQTDSDKVRSIINWEYHPIRTIIFGVLGAPLVTVMVVICLVIETFKIIFDRY